LMALFLSRFSNEYNFIKAVVDSFYDKAKADIIIGYHFRHIENFDTHLPKIYLFWSLQLLELNKEEKLELISQVSMENIIKKHEYLKIKKGEVGRWVLLFQQTIDQTYDALEKTDSIAKIRQKMIRKTENFHKVFLNSKTLF